MAAVETGQVEEVTALAEEETALVVVPQAAPMPHLMVTFAEVVAETEEGVMPHLDQEAVPDPVQEVTQDPVVPEEPDPEAVEEHEVCN